MKKLKYYMFCIKWLWKNREWQNTRQKFKALEKAYWGKNREICYCVDCTHYCVYNYKTGMCRVKSKRKNGTDICDCKHFARR